MSVYCWALPIYKSKGSCPTTYLVDNTAQILVQRRVGKIGNQSEALWLASIKSSFRISNHILLQHSPNISACSCILRENVLRTSQTTLFCSVPMEFYGIL